MKNKIWLNALVFLFLVFSDSWADSGVPAAPQRLRLVTNGDNRPPLVADNSYSTMQGQELVVLAPGVLANDSDPDGDQLSAVLASEPANGTLSFKSDGSFSYTSQAGFAGKDSFTYRARDGELTSNTATVVITVEANPEGVGLIAHWPLDDGSGTTAKDLSESERDLSLTPTGSEPTWGTSHRGGALVFDGEASYARATDVPVDQTAGNKNTVSFWMKWNGGEQQRVMGGGISLVIAHGRFGFQTDGWRNDLRGSTFSPDVYLGRWIHVMAVFANADTSLPSWETAWRAASKIYINGVQQSLGSVANYWAQPRTFSTTQTLGGGTGTYAYPFDGEIADVRIYTGELPAEAAVALANPFAFVDEYLRDAAFSLSVSAPGVLTNDTAFGGRTLTASLVTDAANGQVVLNANGSFVYSPDEDFHHADSFTYQVNDGVNTSPPATVTILSTAPVAADIEWYQTSVNAPVKYSAGGVLFYATDADDDPLTAAVVSQSANGSVVMNSDGSLTYTPDADFTGEDLFTYKVNDGTYDSNIATATVTVHAELIPIPELASWEAAMLSNGTTYANKFIKSWKTISPTLSHSTGPTYYDGQRVFQNIADYLGEASPVYGSEAAHTDDVETNVIILQGDPDLSDVATDGTWRLWLRTGGGQQTAFSVITAVDNTVKTVTVSHDFQIASGDAVDYAITGYWMSAAWGNGEVFRWGTASNTGVKPRNGNVNGWWNFTHGLVEQYLRTGNGLHKEAAVLLSLNAAYAKDAQNPDWLGKVNIRETAYALTSYINAERAGEPRRTGGSLGGYDSRVELYMNKILDYIDWSCVAEADPNYKPFMFGLGAEALVYYWDHIEQDERIVEQLQIGADWTWKNAWRPAAAAFHYERIYPSNAAPDLNLLIAPLYSWLYLQTGDATYRDWGDQIFAGGVKGAWIGVEKAFNQNYRWSFDYLKWREEAEAGL